LFKMLGPQLMVLVWEVFGNLGVRALLEEVGH
jgi:hypothetical protein